MKETTRQLLDRAQDAIEAADILLTNDKADFAAGRAYYAMFYTAEALLIEKGFKFESTAKRLNHKGHEAHEG